MSLFSFQGKIWLAGRSALGQPIKPEWVGNAPSLQLQMQTATTPKNESWSGERMQIGNLRGAKTATVNMTLDEWSPLTLAIGLYATQISLPSGTASAEPLPTPLAAGDVIRLAHPFISDLELETGSTPLVLETDYRIESPSAGLIEFLSAQAAAVTAAYEYEAVQGVTMFTQRPPERWLLLDGINTENGERVLVDLYRVDFNPVGDLNIITDEYGSLPMSGSALFDPINARNANLGGFGRVTQKAA